MPPRISETGSLVNKIVRFTRPTIGDAEIEAASAVLRSGLLVQGAEVAAFEDEFAAGVAGRHCIAVSSGTAALHLAMLALGIGPGDEVVVPSFTFAATVNAVRLCGATPRFADVDEHGCLSLPGVAGAVTDRTTAVVGVHLYGRPADLALRALCDARRLALVEDACQAHGASYAHSPVGTIGDAAAFSFYPSKNMTTGEGGMVVTADAGIARRVRLLRNHGMLSPDRQDLVGTNARMTDVAAAIGRVQLRGLPDALERRRQAARRYSSSLECVVVPDEPTSGRHAWNLYTVRIDRDRDGVAARLATRGVETRVYYATPVHRFTPYRSSTLLPMTDALSSNVLSLPLHPALSDAEVDRVIDELHAAIK